MSAQTPTSQTPQVQGSKLPKVGYLVLDGYKYKYSLPDVRPIDCTRYVSRSGLTFQGCMKLTVEGNAIRDEELPGGLYGSFVEPLISLVTRRKMSRNIVELKSYALKLVSELKENLGLDSKELLIYYDNNTIQVFDKYVRAVDVPLQNIILTKKHGPYTVKLFRLDNYTLNANDFEDYLTNIIEYPVRITTDKKVLLRLWAPEFQVHDAILVINYDVLRLTIGDESGIITEPGLYLILVH